MITDSVKLSIKDEIAYIEWDLVNEKVNCLSTDSMLRFQDLLMEVKQSSAKALIISSKKDSFMAGADIKEIRAFTRKEQFEEAVLRGQSVFNLLEDLPIPTIAAIHGFCMGGGTELVLACDYRVATDDVKTRIGLPETLLGIIPGFGGTWRLPRLIGLEQSLDIILAGKSVDSRKAKKINLIDKRVHVGILMETAEKMARQLLTQAKGKRQKFYKPSSKLEALRQSWPTRNLIFKIARSQVLSKTKGHYPAPLKALEVISKTYGSSNRDWALNIEREKFCDIATGSVARHLVKIFDLQEAVKKQNGLKGALVPARTVTNFGILGAGTMGGGMAYVAADKGFFVRIKDINNEAVALSLRAAKRLWDKKVKKRRMTKYELESRMDRISGGIDWSGFGRTEVVVEAIVEDMEIKKRVLAELAKQVKPGTIAATNTSSLSVNEMAEAWPNPEKFAGLHFFNPVDKMQLVEVVRGDKTDDETVVTLYELAKKMGKLPVVVRDGPGFLVNRLLLPYMSEALHLAQGGLDLEKIDRLFVYEFGMPMGPFALMDEVGLDVCVKVLKIFKKAFGARIEIADCVVKLEESHLLGKKGGSGFYLYDAKGKARKLNPEIYKILGLGTPQKALNDKECIERAIFPMINEAALMLGEDRIVEKPEDVDLAMIFGTGFAPFRGGLLRYADSLGSVYVADQLEFYAAETKSARFKPTVPLRNMAKTDRKFYDN